MTEEEQRRAKARDFLRLICPEAHMTFYAAEGVWQVFVQNRSLGKSSHDYCRAIDNAILYLKSAS